MFILKRIYNSYFYQKHNSLERHTRKIIFVTRCSHFYRVDFSPHSYEHFSNQNRASFVKVFSTSSIKPVKIFFGTIPRTKISLQTFIQITPKNASYYKLRTKYFIAGSYFPAKNRSNNELRAKNLLQMSIFSTFPSLLVELWKKNTPKHFSY